MYDFKNIVYFFIKISFKNLIEYRYVLFLLNNLLIIVF